MDRIEELEESMDSAKASTPTLSTVAFLDGRSFSVGRSEGGAPTTIIPQSNPSPVPFSNILSSFSSSQNYGTVLPHAPQFHP